MIIRYIKSLGYTTLLENVEDLKNRLIAWCNSIRNDPGIFK